MVSAKATKALRRLKVKIEEADDYLAKAVGGVLDHESLSLARAAVSDAIDAYEDLEEELTS